MSSQAESFVEVDRWFVSQGREDQAGLVSFDGFDDEAARTVGIFLIKVAEGFVQQKKFERLSQGAQ